MILTTTAMLLGLIGAISSFPEAKEWDWSWVDDDWGQEKGQ